MSINLAEQLRIGTTKSHSMAENVSFVKSFLGGVVDKNSYRKLVANLYFIYIAIEEEMLANKLEPIIKPIYFPELNRRLSLEKDLYYYYGETWKQQITPSEATEVYVRRIHEVGLDQHELLVAHAYTRYMGDLSGGQILKKIVQHAMQLEGDEGTAFYNFDSLTNESEFKNIYRKQLDKIPVSQNQISDIIAEANIAFTLNMKMFQELNSNLIKIMLMLLTNVIKSLKLNKSIFFTDKIKQNF
jgi:heme oxygenase (biliverdin-producing, ferredoxin)